MIHDEKAKKLEKAGLYRRAAARWLTVLDGCRDASSREWVARQRLRCLQLAETPRSVTDTFGDVRQAATALQKKWDSGSLTGMPSEQSKNIRRENDRYCHCRYCNGRMKMKIRLAFSRLHSPHYY